MMLWATKDSSNQIFSLDPPEQGDEDNWILLTTREVHYKDMAKMLDRQVSQYNKQEDYRAAKVAKDLAEELRRAVYQNTTVN
jgi:hypothetical protein